MLPGPPQKLKCPHCGSHKYIETISSGNTFRAVYWSDFKREYPFLRQPSSIQKCPSCGKYYFYSDAAPKENIFGWIKRQLLRFYLNFIDCGEYAEWERKKNEESSSIREQIFQEAHLNGFGDLSFDEVNAAYDLLYSPKLQEKKKQILLIEWLYAFNDNFNGRIEKVDWAMIPDPIIERQRTIIAEVAKRVKEDKVAMAELLREKGDFEGCIQTLGAISQYKNADAVYAKGILEHAQEGDRYVFQVQFPVQ